MLAALFFLVPTHLEGMDKPKEVVATSTPIMQPIPIKQQLAQVFGSDSVMLDIASCESHYTQFNKDGTVYRGIQNHQDVGIFMINEKYWLAKSIELGYDIYTIEGNISMAEWIYKQSGTQPWHWSYEISPGYGWKYGQC